MIAATVSTLLGSVAAIGIFNLKARARNAVSFVNNIPMLNPDIITGISLFLLFVSLGISQGLTTVVLAHITFCTPYVVLSVMPRLKQMNQNIYEAALDLGGDSVSGLAEGDLPGNPSGYDQWFYPCLHALYRRFRRDHIYDW